MARVLYQTLRCLSFEKFSTKSTRNSVCTAAFKKPSSAFRTSIPGKAGSLSVAYPTRLKDARVKALGRSHLRCMSSAGGVGGLEIDLVPCLSDNYSFLLHDPSTNTTAAVDPADSESFESVLTQKGYNLDFILNTHHHGDHTGGNLALKKKYGATIVGPLADEERIPGIDIALKDGETFKMGSCEAQVFDTPGHTKGHIVYWMPEEKAVFVGDTLFVLGCGRLFEGTPEQMFNSLSKLKALPHDTRVYCAHEYSQENARFCLSRDSVSEALMRRALDITRLREEGTPTVPTTIGRELEANPFLMAETAEEFALVRRAKDKF